MESRIADGFLSDDAHTRAKKIIGSCVHCGMCLPACPTYQLDADERDSPRGRIYLITKMLEDGKPSAVTLRHLDRCLTCRACETACPSGVQYGELAEIGRHAAAPARRWSHSILHRMVAEFFASKWSEIIMLAATFIARPFLSGGLQQHFARKVNASIPSHHQLTNQNHSHKNNVTDSKTKQLRRVAILSGCVEGALSPQTHAALKKVLAACGCEVYAVEGCCGALRWHLNQQRKGKDDMQRNTATFANLLRTNAIDAVVMNASGCHQMISEYPRILNHADADLVYRNTMNAAELIERLWPQIKTKLKAIDKEVVYHSPCTMQNGLKLGSRVENLLTAAGYKVSAPAESNVCCGSAGTYSLLQRNRAHALRRRKLANMESASKDGIYATANIGCQLHLCGGGEKPILHWLELIADLLES